MSDLLQRLRSHHPLECPGNDCTLCGAAILIESLQTKVEELTAEKEQDKENRRLIKMVVESFTDTDKAVVRAALKQESE